MNIINGAEQSSLFNLAWFNYYSLYTNAEKPQSKNIECVNIFSKYHTI